MARSKSVFRREPLFRGSLQRTPCRSECEERGAKGYEQIDSGKCQKWESWVSSFFMLFATAPNGGARHPLEKLQSERYLRRGRLPDLICAEYESQRPQFSSAAISALSSAGLGTGAPGGSGLIMARQPR